jgi:hypothetical protein
MHKEELNGDLAMVTAQRSLERGETMLTVMSRLDAVARSEQLPARLQHYLERRSYLKALEYLENPEAPHRL